MICKKRVGELFLKSFKNDYQNEAEVQKRTAKQLVEKLSEIRSNYESVLELGCGSGILTNEISQNLNVNKLFLNDLSDVSELFKVNAEFIHGDAESIDYPENLDLIISNAVIQWFEDLKPHFEKVAESLTEGGIIAFTTFGPKNMVELRQTLNAGLNYLTKDELISQLSRKFKILYAEEFEYKSYFKTAKGVLRHVQKTGVNGITGTTLTKSKLQKFVNDYQEFEDEKGFELTYNPILVIAKKLHIKKA